MNVFGRSILIVLSYSDINDLLFELGKYVS